MSQKKQYHTIKYAKNQQTPSTSLIPQFISLDNSLDNMITKSQITENCDIFGTISKPVLTFKTKNINKLFEIFKKYNIEVYFNPSYMVNTFQISMFNYKNKLYYEMVKEIMDENNL